MIHESYQIFAQLLLEGVDFNNRRYWLFFKKEYKYKKCERMA
jgi:hypothetical protein